MMMAPTPTRAMTTMLGDELNTVPQEGLKLKTKGPGRLAKTYEGRTAADGPKPDDCLELKARFHELEAIKGAIKLMEADFEASKDATSGQKASTGHFMKPYLTKRDNCEKGINSWMAKKTADAEMSAELALRKAELMDGFKAAEQAKKAAAKHERQQEAAAKRAAKRDREAARDAEQAERGDAAETVAELTAEAKKQLWDAAAATISGLPDTTDENADTRTYDLYTKMKARSEARLQNEAE